MRRVKLIVNEWDAECRAAERGLQALGVPFEIVFKRDRPEYATAYGIGRSPCLLIDDRVAYHGPLAEPDLRLILSAFESTAVETARRERSRRRSPSLLAGGAL